MDDWVVSTNSDQSVVVFVSVHYNPETTNRTVVVTVRWMMMMMIDWVEGMMTIEWMRMRLMMNRMKVFSYWNCFCNYKAMILECCSYCYEIVIELLVGAVVVPVANENGTIDGNCHHDYQHNNYERMYCDNDSCCERVDVYEVIAVAVVRSLLYLLKYKWMKDES